MNGPPVSRRALLATGAAGLAPLAGCSLLPGRSPSLEPTGEPLGTVAGSHRQFQYDAANTGYNASTAVPGGPVRAQWRVETGEPRPSPDALVDDTLYAGVSDGTALALDAADGSEQWRYDAGGFPSLAVADGTAYVTGENALHALDATTGEERWTHDAAALGRVAPTVGEEGGVYLGGRTPTALQSDGTVRWRADALGGQSGGASDGAPFVTVAVVAGTVYAARPGALFALDAANGEEQWRAPLPTDPDGFEGPPAAPVVADGWVFVGGPFGVVCVRDDGERAWHRDVGPVAGLAVAKGRVFAGAAGTEYASQNASGMLFALDGADGRTLWQRTDTEPGIAYGVPFVARDRLFGGAARLAVRDVASGDLEWVLGAKFDRALVLDGAVFLGTETGALYGLR